MSFKNFLNENFIDFVINEFDNNTTERNGGDIKQKNSSWSAKKSEILDTWSNLRPNIPVYMTPIPKNSPDNSSYGEDGIRITGTWPFIASTLSRLKDLISFENDDQLLKLVFKGIDKKSAMPGKQTYVFYINTKERSKRSKSKESPFN